MGNLKGVKNTPILSLLIAYKELPLQRGKRLLPSLYFIAKFHNPNHSTKTNKIHQISKKTNNLYQFYRFVFILKICLIKHKLVYKHR